MIDSSAALFLPASLSGLVVKTGVSSSGSDPSYAAKMPDMLDSYLARKINRLTEEWDRKRNFLRTAADVEARNAFVREEALI